MLHEARPAGTPSLCRFPHARFSAALAADLGPGIAQPDGAVEHEPAWRRIPVAAEIALPLELNRIVGIGAGESRLDPAVRQHFQRAWIEIGREVADIGVGTHEERIDEAHLGRYGVGGGYPM